MGWPKRFLYGFASVRCIWRIVPVNKGRWLLGLATCIGIVGLYFTFSTLDTGLLWELYLSMNGGWMTMFAFVAVAMIVSFTGIWWVLLRPFDQTQSFFALFNARMAGFSMSYLTPGPRVGGEVVRVKLLEGSDTPVILASSVVEKIVLFVSGVLFVAAGLFVAPLFFEGVARIWLYALAGVLITVAVLSWIRSGQGFSALFDWVKESALVPDKYVDHIESFQSVFSSYFYAHRRAALLALLVAVWCKALLVLQVYLLLGTFGVPLSFQTAFFLALGIEVAYAVPSYMGLGFLEGGQASLTAALAIAPVLGLAVALLVRARDLSASAYGVSVMAVSTYYE